MIEFEILYFSYSKKNFILSVKEYDNITTAPIKIVNGKTKGCQVFNFVMSNENYKLFKSNDLNLIILKNYGK